MQNLYKFLNVWNHIKKVLAFKQSTFIFILNLTLNLSTHLYKTFLLCKYLYLTNSANEPTALNPYKHQENTTIKIFQRKNWYYFNLHFYKFHKTNLLS